jgi:tetratricopeptide (TPR) repeat protein
MRLLPAVIVSAFLLLPIEAAAEVKTVIQTVRQSFGGSQSADNARTDGIAKAKREALEQFGTYIESRSVIKDSKFDSDEILALTAGVAKAEVLAQKNYTEADSFVIEITVKVEIDTEVLDKSLKKLLEDRNHLKDLVDSREREKKLLARIEELEKRNRQEVKTPEQSDLLKDQFSSAALGLTVVELFDKALALWDGKKYSDPGKAVEYLTEAIGLNPAAEELYSNRGVAYNNQNQFAKAIDDFNRVIFHLPGDAVAYVNRGFAYQQTKRSDLALADYGRAISINPGKVEAYNNRGNVYSDLNRLDLAIEDYNMAIRTDPKETAAYNNRGNAYQRLKKFDLAAADFDQAIRLDRFDKLAYYNKGVAYQDLGEYQSAIINYSQAIRLDPDYSFALYNRGNAYTHLNQLDLAIDDYSNTIRVDPRHNGAYYNRGRAYFLTGKYDLSISDCTKAIGVDGKDASAYSLRGLSYLLLYQRASPVACADLWKGCTLGNCAEYEAARSKHRCH